MNEDMELILKYLKIEMTLPKKHITKGGSSDQYLKIFYSELDKKTLDKLYHLYEMDFILFDYSPESFYTYVQQ